MIEELKGKTAFITGASRGIGAAASIALARSGVSRVVIHFNSHKQGAEETLQAIRAMGAEATAIQSDMSTQAGIEDCINAIQTTAPEVDILVNNAGSLVKRAPLSDCSSDLYDAVMTLNVKSVWMMTQATVPNMIEKGSGIIVNLSSIAARNGGGHGATVYAAAKAAVSTMTRGMAKELAPKGIRVNAVSPGTVDNYFHEQFSTREMLENVVRNTPLGRLATNEDIANVIVFLCSNSASYIIGQTIELNGGMYMI